MLCPKCNASIPDHSKFCIICGSGITASASNEQPTATVAQAAFETTYAQQTAAPAVEKKHKSGWLASVLFSVLGVALAAGSVAVMYVVGILPPASFERAQELFDNGEYQQSKAVYEKLLSNDKGSIEAYEGIAQCYIKLGDDKKAISTYEDCYASDSYERYLRISDIYLKADDAAAATEILEEGCAEVDAFTRGYLAEPLNDLVSVRLHGSWRVSTVNGQTPADFVNSTGKRPSEYYFNFVFDDSGMKLEMKSDIYTLKPVYDGRYIRLKFDGYVLTMELDDEQDILSFSYVKDGENYTITMDKGRHDLPVSLG